MLDTSTKVLYDLSDVIGYAGWGSNDRNRRRRVLGFHWLPGAIVTEFVSTDGRTFKKPPGFLEHQLRLDHPSGPFRMNSPQTMTADYLIRRRHRRVRPRHRALSGPDPSSRIFAACVLQRPQSCRELLSGHPVPKLAEHRGRRSPVFAGKTIARAIYPHAHAWRLRVDTEPPCVSMRSLLNYDRSSSAIS